MEGEADHKAELVELAKDGNNSRYFSVSTFLKRWITNENVVYSKTLFACA